MGFVRVMQFSVVSLVQSGGEKYPFLQGVRPLQRSRNLWQSQGVVLSARLYENGRRSLSS